MKALNAVAAGVLLIAAGCRTYEGPFVQKTEEQLDFMESIAGKYADSFRKGSFGAARLVMPASPLIAPSASRSTVLTPYLRFS